MTRSRSTRRAAPVAALAAVGLLGGCAFLAEQTAPTKPASTQRSSAALQADALFWTTLHTVIVAGVPAALEALKAAYLQSPGDAETAAHIGFLHIWRLAERARLGAPAAAVTDNAMLARRYFDEAVALHPAEPRYRGFQASSLLAEASIHQDERLQRRGFYAMLDAVDAWPEFNLFTAGYSFSGQPAASAPFQQGLQMQWRTLDLCSGTTIDRSQPDFAPYMQLQTQQGPKRACWNSWIAPHNFEGFFLNMGDMLVKSGDWATAQQVYANARHSPDYARWPYRPVLEARITQAQANVSAFNAPPGAVSGDRVMMIQTRFACMACHQKH